MKVDFEGVVLLVACFRRPRGWRGRGSVDGERGICVNDVSEGSENGWASEGWASVFDC